MRALAATAAAGLAALAALTGPAATQALWGEPVWDRQASAAGGNVNEGRFIAMGGIFGGQRIDCIRCHELDGSGNSSGAFPRLTDQSGWYLYKTLQDYAAGLRPSEIMVPIARTLTLQEMQDVAAYYASVEDAPYPGIETATDVQTLQFGGAIAAVGIPDQGVPACSGCHGPDGIGDAPIVPYLAGQFAPYMQHQLILWKKGLRDGDPMNVMELVARNMTEEQIRAVSLYYASMRPLEVTPEDPVEAGRDLSPGIAVGAPDMSGVGAVRNPEPGPAQVVPGAEPSMRPPQVDFPVGLPRRPLPPGALPPYLSPSPGGEGLESTTTTTGELPDGPSR